jgi:hypothetical protein
MQLARMKKIIENTSNAICSWQECRRKLREQVKQPEVGRGEGKFFIPLIL